MPATAIQAEPLFERQFSRRGIERNFEVATQPFPLLVSEDVFECQPQIRFPSSKTILNKLAIERRILSIDQRLASSLDLQQHRIDVRYGAEVCTPQLGHDLKFEKRLGEN